MAEIIGAVDDLDSSLAATQRRVFGVGKRRYTLNLSDENAEQFDCALGEWTKYARRLADEADNPAVGSAQPLMAVEPVPAPSSRQVRAWARANGWPNLGEHGAVPGEAYDHWFSQVWSAMDNSSWDEPTPKNPQGKGVGDPARLKTTTHRA